jgi:DNA modification methylase
MLKENKIYCGDSEKLLSEISSGSVDMVLTSPPYDQLRSYEGYNFDFNVFKNIAKELYRVIKKHGVLVWVVGDAVVDGSETGTSFKQALYFKELGFNIHDTMIYEKNSSSFPASKTGNRYTQIFEYMFVFSKDKPKCNLLCDKENKWAGYTSFDGKIPPVPDNSPRTNIWKYVTSFEDKNDHPAVFPEKLAEDHILSWSNQGDLVLDIFNGSGTSTKVAYKYNRKYIGMDISEKYCKMAEERIKKARPIDEHDMFNENKKEFLDTKESKNG